MVYVWFVWNIGGNDVNVCVSDVGIVVGVFEFVVKVF